MTEINKRDLTDYGKNYLGPFEQIQLTYRRKKVLEIVEKFQPHTILEVSCAKDSLVNYLHSESYDLFYIVEPIEEFISEAVTQKSEKIICINKRIEETEGLEKIQFDFILISGLLHEVEDPSALMKFIYSIAGTQTIVHVNVPNAFSFHRILAKEMGLIQTVFERSQTQVLLQQPSTFDLESLINLAEATGFGIIEKGSLLIKPFTHAQMQRMIDMRMIDMNTINGLYNMVKYFPEMGSEIYLNLNKL